MPYSNDQQMILPRAQVKKERAIASELYEAILADEKDGTGISQRLKDAIAAYEKYWYSKGS